MPLTYNHETFTNEWVDPEVWNGWDFAGHKFFDPNAMEGYTPFQIPLATSGYDNKYQYIKALTDKGAVNSAGSPIAGTPWGATVYVPGTVTPADLAAQLSNWDKPGDSVIHSKAKPGYQSVTLPTAAMGYDNKYQYIQDLINNGALDASGNPLTMSDSMWGQPAYLPDSVNLKNLTQLYDQNPDTGNYGLIEKLALAAILGGGLYGAFGAGGPFSGLFGEGAAGAAGAGAAEAAGAGAAGDLAGTMVTQTPFGAALASVPGGATGAFGQSLGGLFSTIPELATSGLYSAALGGGAGLGALSGVANAVGSAAGGAGGTGGSAGGAGSLLSGLMSNPGALLSTALGGLLGGANGSKQAGTIDVTSTPWSAQQPYLLSGFDAAAKKLAGTDPLQQKANANYSSLLSQPLTNPYGMGNPYLDQAIKNAQDDVKTQVNSQFGGSNWGTTAHQETLGKTLGNISTNMRFQDYTNQQNLAENAVNRSTAATSNANQFSWSPLNSYMQSIGGHYGGTQSQPYFTNPASSILGGALTGANIYGALFNQNNQNKPLFGG